MNKEQIQQLLNISKQHDVEVPEKIVKEWEELTPKQFLDILKAVEAISKND